MATKDEILDSIEKVMLTVGGIQPYHAKISAEAIYNVLAEEGWLDKDILHSATLDRLNPPNDSDPEE